MNQTNKLGIYVVFITAVLVIAIVGIYMATKYVLSDRSTTSTPTATPTSLTEASTRIASEDTDSDKLPDLIENLYRTLPNNPDTDGDGTLDGEEIPLQRDPTITGPNDTLLDVSATGEVTGVGTYTQKYLATLPSNLDQEDLLTSARLEAFVEEYKGQLLPEIPVSTIKTTTASGEEAVSSYIAAISSVTNIQISAVTSAEIEEAHRLSYSGNQPQPLQDIVIKLENNVKVLQQVAVPAEAVQPHRQLLAASQSLASNVKLLQNMKTDFVGGLIGAKNIELLGPVFEQIANDIGTLKDKYQIP